MSTRYTRDLFPGSNTRMYFHALGRSGCLAGMCYADLRDQPSLSIRMYRINMFRHSALRQSGEPRTQVALFKVVGVLCRTSGPYISAVSTVAQTPNAKIGELVKR